MSQDNPYTSPKGSLVDSPATSHGIKVVVARVALGLCSGLFLALHGFVVFVAIVTNGSELLHSSEAYVAMIAPVLFPTFCIISVCNIIPRKARLNSGLIAVFLVIPAIFCSFLGLGFLMPILVAVWFYYYLVTRDLG